MLIGSLGYNTRPQRNILERALQTVESIKHCLCPCDTLSYHVALQTLRQREG